MAGNSNLNDSARNKQDEFYTQLSLVESELKHYRPHFKGKTVLCNCDDPYEKQFFQIFRNELQCVRLEKIDNNVFCNITRNRQGISIFC